MDTITIRSGKRLSHHLQLTLVKAKQVSVYGMKPANILLASRDHQSVARNYPQADRYSNTFFTLKTTLQRGKDDKNAAFRATVDAILPFWEMTRIKTLHLTRFRERLEKLHAEWVALHKSEKRDVHPGNKRELFSRKMDQLWDIGAEDAMDKIQKNRLLTEENKDNDTRFYLDQRGDRKGHMSGQDKIFKTKAKLQAKRKA